jgi:DNA repair ATPase RecN
MTLTKGDLKQVEGVVYGVLGGKDLDKIAHIVSKELDEKLDEVLDEKLTKFRSDMYDHLDEILREIVAMREEQEMNAHRLSDHEDRIEKLETSVFATI